MGNITYKSDVGASTWTYHATKKHQVLNASGYAYGYDANGNATNRHGNTLTWYSFNLPNRINHGSTWNEYAYNPNRERYKLSYWNGSVTETTIHVGGVLEKWTRSSGLTEWRHYINAGNQPVALYTRQSGSGSQNLTRYFHLDHQGSIEAVTNSDGSLYVRESFNAFGGRRDPTTWSGGVPSGDATLIGNLSRRGYTFHESLGSAGLIHMNGRVMDPLIGRFLSADPFIPEIDNTQSWNRYSYVNNNPLSYVDPSGFFLKKLFKKIGRFFKKYWRPIVAIVAAAVTYGAVSGWMAAHAGATAAAAASAASGSWALGTGAYMSAYASAAGAWSTAAIAGAASGLVAGGITGGIKGAVIGGFTGLAFGFGNGAWGGVSSGLGRGVGRALTVGTIGGGATEAMGGRFSDGFWVALGASAANSIYESVVRYRATWRPGGDAVQKTANSPPVEGANNIGVQGRPLAQPGFAGEGGSLSRVLNRVLGINAVAGLHDEIVTHLGGSWRSAMNFPTMAPAAAVTAAALVNDYSVMLTFERYRERKQSVIAVPPCASAYCY